MKTENKDFKAFESKFDSFMNKIEKLFKGSKAFKADVTLTTNDGKVINVVTEDENIEGKPATIDGSPAPAGDHSLDDGRVITVDDAGTITAVKAAEGGDPEAEALKKEIATLKASLSEKDKKVAELEKNLTSAKTEGTEAMKIAKEVQTEFTNFKKSVTGDDGDKGGAKEIAAKEWANMSNSQRILELRKRERAAAKK